MFHVLVVQSGIVVEKTNFEKNWVSELSCLGNFNVDAHVKTTLKCFQLIFRKSLGGYSLNCFEVIQFFSSWGEGSKSPSV